MFNTSNEGTGGLWISYSSISFSKGEKWYDKLFNVKYLPLFHHFKAIYQFPKHIIVLDKIVANASYFVAY
jgi:hypothetical protein